LKNQPKKHKGNTAAQKRAPEQSHSDASPGGVLSSDIKTNHPLAQCDSAKNENNNHSFLSNIKSDFKKPSIWIELFALLVLVGYACFTYQQKEAMIESNRINKEALIAVQRAFVTFSTAINIYGVLSPKTGKITEWNFSVPINNSGATPTRNMTISAGRHISSAPLPSDFKCPTATTDPELVALGPRDKIYTAQFGNVQPQVIAEVKSGVKDGRHLYFCGWAKYDDIFAVPHVTKFCYDLATFGPDPFSGIGPQHTFLNGCGGRHNCTDEDCPDYRQFVSKEKR
jgi:hypothetical protein